MDSLDSRPLGRRTVLGGGLATLLLAGCGVSTQRPPASVAGLLAQSPFYIAHRGGGDNWPEMTAYAYSQAARLDYVSAIEISVCRSADGVLVCSHDPNTRRMTGVDRVIADQPWSALAGLRATAAYTVDPRQAARPLSRLDAVLARHLAHLVVFVEPKTPATVAPLLDALAALGQPERVVWKQPVNQRNFGAAKRLGFTTWGYALDEPSHRGERFERFAASPEIDLLGVGIRQSEIQAREVVTAARRHGKPVIMWPIHTVADRALALARGGTGMMTANVVEVPAVAL